MVFEAAPVWKLDPAWNGLVLSRSVGDLEVVIGVLVAAGGLDIWGVVGVIDFGACGVVIDDAPVRNRNPGWVGLLLSGCVEGLDVVTGVEDAGGLVTGVLAEAIVLDAWDDAGVVWTDGVVTLVETPEKAINCNNGIRRAQTIK